MKSYSDIKAEIAKLERQAEAALKTEVAGVVEKIKTAIAAYGLTATDLGFGGTTKKDASTPQAKAGAKAPTTMGVAKYRDPKTQKTWTGRGKPPAWIAGVKDRDAYLITSTPADTPRAGAVARRSKPVAAKKKARAARKTGPAPIKTPAVQIESGAASE